MPPAANFAHVVPPGEWPMEFDAPDVIGNRRFGLGRIGSKRIVAIHDADRRPPIAIAFRVAYAFGSNRILYGYFGISAILRLCAQPQVRAPYRDRSKFSWSTCSPDFVCSRARCMNTSSLSTLP
jgi:hypothetical protein